MTRTRIAVGLTLLAAALICVWLGWVLLDGADNASQMLCIQNAAKPARFICSPRGGDAAGVYASTALVSMGTALLGAAVVLVLVDWLLGGLEGREAKRFTESQQVAQLMAQIRSGSHDFAMSAINELRAVGALTNGSLLGMSWAHAHLGNAPLDGAVLTNGDFTDCDLTGAHLMKAMLAGADFADATLTGANLCWADLTGATVDEAQLRSADMLWNALLPDGSRYNGRFGLEGDLGYAAQLGVDPADEIALSAFYGAQRT